MMTGLPLAAGAFWAVRTTTFLPGCSSWGVLDPFLCPLHVCGGATTFASPSFYFPACLLSKQFNNFNPFIFWKIFIFCDKISI
jgi:hypothetical protein